MEWLNYHHFFYFWLVAREGGLVQAARVLKLSHPTLSAQIHALEERLGEKLFTKVGRRLVLTEMGRVAYRYGDEIFSLGREMMETLRGQAVGRPIRLNVGMVDLVPKLVVKRLLEPALAMPDHVRLVCHENSFERLLSDLALHALDIVISDAPLPPGGNIRAYSHLLGECGVTFFATKALAAKYKRGFPKSLDGAPFLLPLEHLPLRRSLNHWFEAQRVHPRLVGEFEDSALLKVFGSDGHGVFPAPTVIEKEVKAQYEVVSLGRITAVKERFYAISAERRLMHPAVIAISESARHELFAA